MACLLAKRGYELNIYTHPLHDQRDRLCGLFTSRSGPGTARYLIHVQPVFCELSLIAFPLLLLQPPSLVEVVGI